MERREESDSLPIDLVVQILSRLPSKSIGRFRCVSKLWETILQCPYFKELFLTRSSAHPRLLLAFEPGHDGPWCLYSPLQLHNPHEESSPRPLVVAADLQMKFPGDNINKSICGEKRFSCAYASGLICFDDTEISEEYDYDLKRVVCNPSTGQHVVLPNQTGFGYVESRHFLGFDPIDKQYKVLMFKGFIRGNESGEHRILTLGTMMWRKIQCPLQHEPLSEGICINGVLYYLSCKDDFMIVCFDVRSEKFKFIEGQSFHHSSRLINSKGRIGVISKDYVSAGGCRAIELRMRVLEDIEKQEWSEDVYNLPENIALDELEKVYVVGLTSTGEIVLSMEHSSKPFYVFYFNPERNSLQAVEIQGNKGFGNLKKVHIYLDHVEDLKFNMMNVTYISPPEQKLRLTSTSSSPKEEHHEQQEHHEKQVHQRKQNHRTFETINKFDALCLLDDDVGEAECDSSITDHVDDVNSNIMKRTSTSPPKKKQRKPKRTSKEDHPHQKQDRPTVESINEAEFDFSFKGFLRVLLLGLLIVLLVLVIMFMSMFMF